MQCVLSQSSTIIFYKQGGTPMMAIKSLCVVFLVLLIAGNVEGEQTGQTIRDKLAQAQKKQNATAPETSGPRNPDSDAKPLSHWVAMLKASEPRVRSRAASALGRIGPAAKPAVPELMRALEDKDFFVRASAAEALEKIRTDE